MKPALHWRIILWQVPFFGIALLLFGAGARALAVGMVACLCIGLGLWLRRRLTDPLSGLTESLRRDVGHDASVPTIPRGAEEVRDLIIALADWQRALDTRIRTLSDDHVRLGSILRAMEEGVLVFDDTGRITMSNAAFFRLLEVQRDPQGMTAVEIFRNDALHDAVGSALRGERVDAVEFQTSSNRTLRAVVSPVIGEGGRVEAAVMVLEDLTDIRQVDRVRRDFVANVSHEFKTPLTSIRGYAETMMSELSEESHRDFADTIVRNARYLESLVNDLLVLAQIEAEPPGALDDVDLRALVNEQIGMRRKVGSDAPDEIKIDCPSIQLRTDSARLVIALSNLIDNAIRYNRPSGTIRIVGRTEGRYLVLEVTDEGFGIPQYELPRIFERFYRVDKARTRNSGGTGLGLAIARHAVESQGGTLTVTSQAGAGSTFRITLPLRLAEPDGQPRG